MKVVFYLEQLISIYIPQNLNILVLHLKAIYCGSWILSSESRGLMESVVDDKAGNLSDNEEPENGL